MRSYCSNFSSNRHFPWNCQTLNKQIALFNKDFRFRVLYLLWGLVLWGKVIIHNFITSLVTLILEIQGQIIKLRTIFFCKSECYAMGLCKFKLKYVTSHFDKHLPWPLFSRSYQWKWMHNNIIVNNAIQPYFVLSYKKLVMHVCSIYGILLTFKQLSLIDWICYT